jgi:hypothetical protein
MVTSSLLVAELDLPNRSRRNIPDTQFTLTENFIRMAWPKPSNQTRAIAQEEVIFAVCVDAKHFQAPHQYSHKGLREGIFPHVMARQTSTVDQIRPRPEIS